PTSALPAPVLPRSSIQAVTNPAPWKPVVGVNVVPLRAVLIADSVPVNLIDGSAVPSPSENVRPLTPPRVSAPLPAFRVSATGEERASGSATKRAVPPAAEKVNGVFRAVTRVPGAVTTGIRLAIGAAELRGVGTSAVKSQPFSPVSEFTLPSSGAA